MRWTRSAWASWLPASELVAGARHLDLPSEPYLLPRAIGGTGEGSGYWVLAAVRTVSEREMREREVLAGGWQYDPLFKDAVYSGVVWQVDRDGTVLGAAAFDTYPDGLAGPDHFFSVTEDPTTGFRGVRIYRLGACAPLDGARATR